ncbi:hypothetical protein PVIIG_06302 [Plasmodium vivax India VII]|uniref:PIR Superfamily Protein n=1 Tax=Plasmodium vivax India VII TaxID=1077284 RepID=A0A0J9UU30_PLAVI|nr:hypothetical protein PVIIG_06302 [Plasmodium vivax India VII]
MYEFFQNIEDYIKKAKSAAVYSKDESECNSFVVSSGSYFKDTITAKGVCNEFIKLYVSLSDLRSYKNDNVKYVKCSKFFNYWVNFKLKESMKNEYYTFSHVFNAIESHITLSDFYDVNLDFVYDIKQDDLSKMNILYSLYEKYTDLYTILNDMSNVDKVSTLSYSNECYNIYNNAISMCKGEKNKFVEELERYKKKYETLYELVEKRRSDYYTSFVRLTNDNNNIVTTSVLGTTVALIPLFGLLYKVLELIIKL